MIVRQAAHVLDLLEYFVSVKEPANLAEISAAMGWPRSSTFNLLSTLAQRGFLYEPRPRGGFYPSPKWMSVLQGITETERLPDELCASVREIADATGETVVVAAPAGINVVFLYVAESDAAVRFSTQIGEQMPIHVTAAGRALLALYPARERVSVIKKIKFDKNSPRSLASAELVEAEIRRGEARGWHENVGGFAVDLSGVAMAVGSGDRRLSVAVGGPTTRLRQRMPQIAATLKRLLKRSAAAPRGPK
jgi:IclR family acetate operon transcriptional repressor